MSQKIIFLADNSDEIRKLVKDFLTKHGHIVRLEAETKKEALKNIDRVKEEGINVAIMDKSLGMSFHDGAEIAIALKSIIPGIKLICLSLTGGSGWAHVDVLKGEKLNNLVEIVTNI